MSIFGITTVDMQQKLAPVNDEEVFLIETGDEEDGDPTPDLSQAECEKIIAGAEDVVLSRLKDRYRRLCRRVDGEVLVNSAAGGETTLQLSLYPVVEGTLRLYKNFADLWGDRWWDSRDDRMAMSADEYTLEVGEGEGVVTLTTPLILGDSVWAEYHHTGAGRLAMLRDVAMTLAAVEIARRFNFFRSAEGGLETFEKWESSAFGNLNRATCIDLLDTIELVHDETNEGDFYGAVRRMDVSGGGDDDLTRALRARG